MAWTPDTGAGPTRLGLAPRRLVRRLRQAPGGRRVGKELEALEGEGWKILHDVDKGRSGNCDHVAIAPSGEVFTIETKLNSFRSRALAQAHAHARWARDEYGESASPLLCVANKSFAPKQYADVWCMGAPHIADFLRSRLERDLSEFEDRLARAGLVR